MHTSSASVFHALSNPVLDHKPAIAITDGDLLSISERARVRVYLGELLGVHPSKQTFDIPDDREPTTELTIVDMTDSSREIPTEVDEEQQTDTETDSDRQQIADSRFGYQQIQTTDSDRQHIQTADRTTDNKHNQPDNI
ncbi:hypothetical protein Tco_1047572 [Tanacetum coccineum]